MLVCPLNIENVVEMSVTLLAIPNIALKITPKCDVALYRSALGCAVQVWGKIMQLLLDGSTTRIFNLCVVTLQNGIMHTF